MKYGTMQHNEIVLSDTGVSVKYAIFNFYNMMKFQKKLTCLLVFWRTIITK